MSVTMLPSGGLVTGWNPNAGSNTLIDEQVSDIANDNTNPVGGVNNTDDALTQLYNLAKDNPEYWEIYLQTLAERENTTNAQQWYEKMSGSQYQRAVKDLEAAGLNPYLALTNLSGAGSGSVSPAGTWSTSPYANKVAKDNSKSQSLTARSNMLKTLATMSTAMLGIMAMML